MSKLKDLSKYAVITCMFALGIGSGVATSAYLSDSPDQRQPASPNRQFVPFEHAKSSAPLRVEISKGVAIPESATDEVILTGRIVSVGALNGPLSFAWDLPEGVQVIEGDTSGEFTNVPQGHLIEVRLRLSGFSKEKQSAVILQAKGLRGSRNISASDLIVSRAEDTEEHGAMQLRLEAEAQLGTETK